MEFAVWAYPWDLRDEGVDTTIGTLQDLGIGEVNLATNYHSVQTFNPRNPERRTWFSQASSYFQPGDGYGELSPIPNERMDEDDWVAEIGAAFAESPLRLNSWTIGCHNSRLGARHPEYALRTPHDDPLVFGLCPSQPAVQRYLRTMVSDLDGRGTFDRIELETFDYFYGTGFGWHHDKFHTRLGDLGEFLFGLCFCEACRKSAQDAGIDVETVQEICRDTVDAIAEGELPYGIEPGEWLLNYPSVWAYVDHRTETLTDLYHELASVATEADLGTYVGMLDVEDGWKHGLDLEALAEPLDYATVIAYEGNPDDVGGRIRTARQLTDADLHVGVLPAHPHVYDSATLENIVDTAVEEDVDRVSFYNYGLLPERNLEWVRSAITPHR